MGAPEAGPKGTRHPLRPPAPRILREQGPAVKAGEACQPFTRREPMMAARSRQGP
jgi:hypothetical protein